MSSHNSQPRLPILMHSPIWLNAFSFLLQNDNVICQALLDSWGESGNPCTIYMLLRVPLDTLTITYGRTSNAQPLSNAFKNQITEFQDMYDHCSPTAKPPGLIITSLISPHPTLTAMAFWYLIIMIGCPQCSHYDTALMLPHVIESLWSHQIVLMMGRSLEFSWVLNTFLRNHTTFMMRCLMHPPILTWPYTHSWSSLCNGKWCVHQPPWTQKN
jgi:hypothetical protein